MTSEGETGVLALLLAMAALLYAVTWSFVGPRAYPDTPPVVAPLEQALPAEAPSRLASSVPAPR